MFCVLLVVKPDMLIAGDEAHRKSSKKDAVTSITEGRMRKNMLKDKSTEDVKNKKPKHDKVEKNPKAYIMLFCPLSCL